MAALETLLGMELIMSRSRVCAEAGRRLSKTTLQSQWTWIIGKTACSEYKGRQVLQTEHVAVIQVPAKFLDEPTLCA